MTFSLPSTSCLRKLPNNIRTKFSDKQLTVCFYFALWCQHAPPTRIRFLQTFIQLFVLCGGFLFWHYPLNFARFIQCPSNLVLQMWKTLLPLCHRGDCGCVRRIRGNRNISWFQFWKVPSLQRWKNEFVTSIRENPRLGATAPRNKYRLVLSGRCWSLKKAVSFFAAASATASLERLSFYSLPPSFENVFQALIYTRKRPGESKEKSVNSVGPRLNWE